MKNGTRLGLVAMAAAMGLAGLTTAGPSQAASVEPGIVVDYASHTVQVKPKSFQPFRDVTYTEVRWIALSSITGDATATREVNTCRPDCAAGNYRRTPVQLHFTTVVASYGRRVFSLVRVTDLETRATSTTKLPVAAVPAKPGVVVDYASGVVGIMPKTFRPYKDVVYTNVRWTRLNATTGDATATRGVNTCRPDCAAGNYRRTPVRLHFTGVKVAGGERVFSRAEVTDVRTGETFSSGLPVSRR
ncbi:hypothetical protein AB0J83_25725 [Actinoplanes sp. NPDC049596]|uniref:hypothetical protein n=1 Tax=unclassified Actinoplanes TaxID=2626549 RepID=UPI003426CDB3